MIERIKNILNGINDISGYKIFEQKIESRELFIVKRNLDMNRAKKVHNLSVTVYKDFEEDGAKYKGSSTTIIHPTMKDDEIRKALKDAAFSAGFVKNKYYPLVNNTNNISREIKSNFNEKSMDEWLPELIKALQSKDIYDKGGINSAEIFLNEIYTRIVNSEGVDVSSKSYEGQIEIIVSWKEESEEVELFRNIDFASFDKEMIENTVKDMLMQCVERAKAKDTPALDKYTVILSGEAVKEFLGYYYEVSNAKEVYEQSSTAVVMENIQGKEVKGDLINIKLNPLMENSTKSACFDNDGYPLSEVSLYENGILKRYWGNNQYSHYLSIDTTGNIGNFEVSGGQYSLEELKREPYIEALAFSAFGIDTMTGDFGGEIRLGWYFDGEKCIPVSGGSITGNIKKVHGNMYLSKELQKDNEFIGPKSIKLLEVTVAGK